MTNHIPNTASIQPAFGPRTYVWTALLCIIGIWLTAVWAAGLNAAGVFASMSELQPSSASLAGYQQPWQWRYIAGQATQGAFHIADITQFICLPTAFLLLFWQHKQGQLLRSRVLDHLRTYAVLLAGILLMVRWQAAQMPMNTLLKTEQDAVSKGDWALAQLTQDTFLTYHDTASMLWTLSAVVLVIAFTLTAMAAGRRS
jgi:hypothetical protein